MLKQWFYIAQVALLTVGGLHLLLLTATEAWRGRDINSVMLVLWIVGGLFSAIVLNFAINARSFLLIVPPTAILLVRRLEAMRGNLLTTGRMVWPLIPAVAISLSLAVADYQLASSARTAAGQIVAGYKPAGHQLWFEGHGGFQYYMEMAGGQPIDVERSSLQPGDFVVIPKLGGRVSLPPGAVGWVESQVFVFNPIYCWMNLMGGSSGGMAGFYGANFGPVPFAFGKLTPQYYFILKVFSHVQYFTQLANPQEVQAGANPSVPQILYRSEPWTIVSQPEVMNRVRLASQLERGGKSEKPSCSTGML
jgi:hypothetical protein